MCCNFVATLLLVLLHLKYLPDNDVADVAPFLSYILIAWLRIKVNQGESR
jgi:hypothetical protein